MSTLRSANSASLMKALLEYSFVCSGAGTFPLSLVEVLAALWTGAGSIGSVVIDYGESGHQLS